MRRIRKRKLGRKGRREGRWMMMRIGRSSGILMEEERKGMRAPRG